MSEPFNLPRGTVRAVVTILVCLGFVPVCIFGSETGVGAYAALSATVIQNYFHVRKEQNKADGPPVSPSVVND